MIHLVQVSKSYRTRLGTKSVIRPTSLSLPTNRRIGVLGRNGAGKSTLLNLIAGVEEPSTGQVIATCSISFPVGFAGGVHGDLSGAENTAFIARIYDADVDAAMRFVESFSELGEDFRLPVRTYSTGMKARLSFSVSMAIDFECYLMDEITAVGDARFAAKCRRALLERAERSGVIYVSHNDVSVRRLCEMAIVLYNGHLVPFESLEEAISFYHGTLAA